MRPLEHEEDIRTALIGRVQSAVQSMNPGAKRVEVQCFGSFAAGLYLPTADMDLVAVSQTFLKSGMRTFCQNGTQMHRLARHLQSTGVAQPDSVSVVVHAKVPIIKYVDRVTGIKVDISFENASGLVANRTFAQWKQEYPSMPVIVVMIKQMLAMRDLNEVFTGGLGGFSIICLVVSMLQLMPEQQSETAQRDDENYANLLLKFLDLYGNDFNLQTTGIEMNPPGYFDKILNPMNRQNNNTLTIVDPNNSSNDISGGSREVRAVFDVFRKAHASLSKRLSQVQRGQNMNSSILGCVLGGNYAQFDYQRDRLSRLARGLAISPPPEQASSAPDRAKRPKPKPKNTRGGTQTQLPYGVGTASLPPRPSVGYAAPPQQQGYVNHFTHPQSSLAPNSYPLQLGQKESTVSMDDGGLHQPLEHQYTSESMPAGVRRSQHLKHKHPHLAASVPSSLTKTEHRAFLEQHNLTMNSRNRGRVRAE